MNYEEFKQAFYDEFRQALALSEKAWREGLLSLEEDILEKDKTKCEQRDVLFYGLRFAIDGTDKEIIEKILSNLVNQEKDEYLHLLKTIQKEAVLSILSGYSPRILFAVLNSYTDIPLNDPVMKDIFDN
ncbi:MAG: hypothetical protein FWH35_00085 [Treponema sp.]|nr:hypothetical protein [Treponema sp.]